MLPILLTIRWTAQREGMATPRYHRSVRTFRENGHLPWSVNSQQASDQHVLCSAAHLLASSHSTSRSSSLSDLFPTRTTTRCGLASALASANHLDKFKNESRLQNMRCSERRPAQQQRISHTSLYHKPAMLQRPLGSSCE